MFVFVVLETLGLCGFEQCLATQNTFLKAVTMGQMGVAFENVFMIVFGKDQAY